NSFNSSLRHAANGVSGPCTHERTGQNAGQTVCLNCGELLPASAPAPAFDELSTSGLWCSACGATVSFRRLPQLDGTEVYLCNDCDTEVERKLTTAPPARNGTHAPADGLRTAQPSAGDEDAYDEGVIV